MRHSIPLLYGIIGATLTLGIGIFIGSQLPREVAPQPLQLKETAIYDFSQKSSSSWISSTASPSPHSNKNDVLEETPLPPQLEHFKIHETDPVAFLEETLTTVPGTMKEQTMLYVVDQWASQNSNAAFNWLEKNAERLGTHLPDVYTVIMTHHIIQNPESAKHAISDMHPGTLKNTLASQVAITIAEQQPLEALRWSESLEDKDSRQRAMEIALQTYTALDSQAALQYAQASSDEITRTQMLQHVGFTMAGIDPIETSKKLSLFPKETHAHILPRIAWAWAQKDPAEAADWIDQMPNGTVRDQAIREASWNIISADPKQAFALASSVTDPATHYGLVRDSLLALHRMDPETAQQTLASYSNLTKSQKDLLKTDLEQNAPAPDLVLPN